jgi:excisionase family DNA binding protein
MGHIAYSVTTAANAVGLTKPHIVAALLSGELIARRVGDEVIITAKDLRRWVQSKPIWVNAGTGDVLTS